MACDCKICRRHKEYERQLYNLNEVVPFLQEPGGVEEAIEFLEGIYEQLSNIEQDNSVNRAIIEGSWPMADELISIAREKVDGKE